MVKMFDGTIVGKRCRTFSYTNCWVHHIGDYEGEFVPKVIARVKVTGVKKRWVTGVRPTTGGDLYEDDCVTRIKGISTKKKEKLMEIDISKVKHLTLISAFDDENIRSKVLCIQGIGKEGLSKLEELAASAKPGAYESVRVDHRRMPHPYKSRFPETWSEELEKDIRKWFSMVCITELIRHILKASAEVMKGTTHESDWYFYHNALQQLADPRTRQWMIDQGVMKRWLVPIDPCNEGTVYQGCPIGNTPEVMPWDESLNQDVHLCVDNHSNFFKCVTKENPLYLKRFSKATPAIMLKSYL